MRKLSKSALASLLLALSSGFVHAKDADKVYSDIQICKAVVAAAIKRGINRMNARETSRSVVVVYEINGNTYSKFCRVDGDTAEYSPLARSWKEVYLDILEDDYLETTEIIDADVVIVRKFSPSSLLK